MSRNQRPAVQRYHDRVAHLYDDSYRDAYWRWHDALTWDYLKPFLPRDANATVLDLGCGTGKWGGKLLDSGYRVVCVDISAKMLEQARRNLLRDNGDESSARHEGRGSGGRQRGSDGEGRGPDVESPRPGAERRGLEEGSGRVEFVQADLCDLSQLPRGGAALAVAMGDAIGCAESPPTALKQIRRALSDEGVLVATFDNRLAAIDFYLSSGDPRSLAGFLKDGKTHWLTKDATEQFPITTYGPSELVKLVERCGFTVLDLVGKTVLPMRQHRAQLEDGEAQRFWAQVEKRLCRDPAAMGRAAHLQIACRVRR